MDAMSTPSPDPSPAPAAPPGAGGRLGAEGLRPVSETLIRARYLAGLVGYALAVLVVAGCIVVWAWLGWWWTVFPALLVLILALQSLLLTPRRVRALGYLDREDDLVFASGIMFRSVSTVAFARVQSVEVHEGPIERSLGLATLSVSTASAEADLTIPGLPREEAERLRALLARRGVETMAAL